MLFYGEFEIAYIRKELLSKKCLRGHFTKDDESLFIKQFLPTEEQIGNIVYTR